MAAIQRLKESLLSLTPDDGEGMYLHVYTDGRDSFMLSLPDAIKQVVQWFKEGYRNLRIEANISDFSDCHDDEITVWGVGDFPS